MTNDTDIRLTQSEREALLHAWPWPQEAATSEGGFNDVAAAVVQIIADRLRAKRAAWTGASRVRPNREQSWSLTDFLLARIAEDEAVANGEGGWQPGLTLGLADRMSAECEAKRGLITEAADWLDRLDELETIGGRVRKLLALPYADHPDYRDEWRP